MLQQDKAFSYKGYELKWYGEKENEIARDQYGFARVNIDTKYYRQCELDLLSGDPSKAIKELGWYRDYDTLDKLIVDMFEN